MANMESPAGDMEIRMQSMQTEGNKLIVIGRMGIWDAKIYFEPTEVVQLMGLLFNFSVIKYLLKLPFTYWADARSKRKTVTP
jgi:hypothetical protein